MRPGRCQWRASLPCGFWSRRNVVSITGFLAIRRREKLWYLFGAAAGLFPLGCLILVTGPQPVLENLFVFPVLHPAPAVISVRAVEKPALILFFAHLTAFLINLVAGWRAIRIDPRNVGARMLLAA